MSFNSEYKQYYEFVHNNIYQFGHSPTAYLELYDEMKEAENFEACKAIKDVLLKWCEEHEKA
jgi:hypothetical protein